MKKAVLFGLFLLFALPSFAESVDIVSDMDEVFCEEYLFHKELRVYKDPSLFMELLNDILDNPKLGWKRLLSENPLLTSLQGTTFLMRLGLPRPFKGFGEIAALYEMADPRFKKEVAESPQKVPVPNVVPVRVCGLGSAYSETLGFVIESDLEDAQIEEKKNGRRPPTTLGNPILPLDEAPNSRTYLP